MTDIWVAIVVMSAVSLVTALLAGRYLYVARGQSVMLLFALAVVATFYFLFYGSGQLVWARLVPTSAAIIYTNFAAVFAALAAGWAWRLPNTPGWRRAVIATLMGMTSLLIVCWPLASMALRPPPPGGDDWEDGIAMQSAWATCSPAAAATLLHHEGINVSEKQMVPLCLTDEAGTPTLGLYRGIKLMANDHGRRVQIVDRALDRLLADDSWPVLLSVRLPFGVADRRFADEWGWIPGMGHSVVALGRSPDGGVVIGDPATGREVWSAADMQLLWHGNGIRLR